MDSHFFGKPKQGNTERMESTAPKDTQKLGLNKKHTLSLEFMALKEFHDENKKHPIVSKKDTQQAYKQIHVYQYQTHK